MQPNGAPTISRPDSLGSEGLEASQNLAQNQQLLDNEKKAMNNVWNTFLSAEPSAPVSFTRLDSAGGSSETPKLSFDEVYAKIRSEDSKSSDLNKVAIIETHDSNKVDDLVGTHEVKEFQPDYVPAPVVEEKKVSKMEGAIMFEKAEAVKKDAEPKEEDSSAKNTNEFKKHATATSKEVLQNTIKISKFGIKGGKEVVNAVSDLWNNFIGFREKKADPRAKENAEKAAKRKANKQQFMGLLREGISLYYSAMRKALMELEVKLGVNVIGAEERNRFLGRNRNMSYRGNDSIYAIHQTAYEMMEQRKRQQQASSAPSGGRGKPSRGQMFTDKTLQGERSGGNNMMSAVG